jgi:RHS repeat-associated protein
VQGSPAQTLYCGIDQIGSVRRVFSGTTSATAYGYDPYGLPLQATAPITDFVYGGMFYNADSGLYLTNYRAYDPIAGRWLSRDPIGEQNDPVANLYAYVGGNAPNLTDPLGLVASSGPSVPFRLGPDSCAGPPPPGRPPSGRPPPPPSAKPPPPAKVPTEPPLKRMHSDETTKSGNKLGYDYWSKKSNQEIIDSLKPGAKEPLIVNERGTVMQGNTRIFILEERGVDPKTLNALPRVPHTSGTIEGPP